MKKMKSDSKFFDCKLTKNQTLLFGFLQVLNNRETLNAYIDLKLTNIP